MSSLPPELIGQISASLDAPALRRCCFVSQDFRTSAQSFLFSDLSLPGLKTLAATISRCDFFLADQNLRLSRHIKKLTIGVERLPICRNDQVPTELITLLVKIGPQLDTLCINGTTYDGAGFQFPTQWNNLSPLLRDCFLKHVMPSLRSLELQGIVSAPLFTIIRNIPFLRYLNIGSMEEKSPLLSDGDSITFSSRELVTLSIGHFFGGDFNPGTTLAQFLDCSSGVITSLNLWSHYITPELLSLQFLLPFPSFTSHLRYLSLGRCFFDQVVRPRGTDLLPLAMFPQLENLSFSIAFASYTARWFNWISDCLKLTLSKSLEPTISLKVLHFSIRTSRGEIRSTLNELGHNRAFKMSMEFTVDVEAGKENPWQTFRDIRRAFPIWDQAGRLNLWVDIESDRVKATRPWRF
ncbi:hypothetical protein DL96DRAFT_1640219 [Flagelloscypha sp. PMI_526]|nr:hypothetical protein DL96DRAFT_1640219 [Flagelloscypha sp. PMI_526]